MKKTKKVSKKKQLNLKKLKKSAIKLQPQLIALLLLIAGVAAVGWFMSARMNKKMPSKLPPTNLAAAAAGTSSTVPLADLGGPVLTNPKLYVVWMGTGFNASDQASVNGFVKAFVNSKYTTSANEYLRGDTLNMSMGSITYDTADSLTTAPRAEGVKTNLVRALGTLDPNGIYIVYGSNYAHYGQAACAWHDFMNYKKVNVPVVYVPNDFAAGTPSLEKSCTGGLPFRYPASTASAYSQAVANLTAHETMEAITDPMPCTALVSCADGYGDPAWDNSQVYGGVGEIADLCAWNFNAGLSTLTDNSVWSLQGEWSNAKSTCVVSGS